MAQDLIEHTLPIPATIHVGKLAFELVRTEFAEQGSYVVRCNNSEL
jgi:hypothetical protein